ncbi:MAG: putative repeat protein (TIGR03806 family) [Zhongshania sp.]
MIYLNSTRILAALLITALSACGGGPSSSFGSGGSSSNPPSEATELSGYFIGGPISGAQYQIQGANSIPLTGGDGGFKYFSGDIIQFAIGSITLGKSLAAEFITPMDIQSSEQAAINLSRFLLTLDEDKDPDNGIQISSTVRDAAAGISLGAGEFEATDGEFDSSVLADFARSGNGDSRALIARRVAEIELACSTQDISDGSFDGDCNIWYIVDDNSPASAPNGDQTQEQVATLTALFAAKAGDTIEFSDGVFEFTTTLDMAHKQGITLKGQGMAKTIFDFAQSKSPEGISMSHMTGITIEEMTVLDTPGFSVKVSHSNFVTLRNLRAMWSSGGTDRGGMDPKIPSTLEVTCEHPWPNSFARPGNVPAPRLNGGPIAFPLATGLYTDANGLPRNYSIDSSNGGYAIYPVLSNNVLLDNVVSLGASDAGIYVGQSNDIIVKNSEALFNVAGYEIENSDRADMHDNVAHCNTAGFLVFDLPGLNQYGEQTRIFNNYAGYNNLANFAPGGVVSAVPQGTGLLQLGYDKVEFFNNVVEFNRTLGYVGASHELIDGDTSNSDKRMDLYPEGIYIHSNIFTTNGTLPQLPEEGVLICQDGTGGDTNIPCIPTGIDVGHDSLLPVLVQLRSLQAQDGYIAQGAHIIWDGYYDEAVNRADGVQCTDFDDAPLDADGKPDYSGQNQPSCRYNRYKFAEPNNASDPKRRHPDYWLCIDQSDEYGNTFSPESRTFMNFDGMELDTAPKTDLADHDCTTRFGEQLPRLAPAVVQRYIPGNSAEQPPSAAEVAAICESDSGTAVNRDALAFNCSKLSHYNLFADQTDPRSGFHEDGVIYDLVTPLFSDYSVKYRVLFLPPGESAAWAEGNINAPNATLDFPVGTVIAKTFAFRDRNAEDENLVETRLLIHRAGQGDSSFWEGMSYVWREDRSAADIALAGGSKAVSWDYDDTDPDVTATYVGSTDRYAIPTPNQCGNCHNNEDRQAGDAPIGPKVRNLNRSFDYGNGPENQLQHLIDIGKLSGAPILALDSKQIATNANRLPRFNVPGDSYQISSVEAERVAASSDANLEYRARAWLEVNCAHCHNRKGQAQSTGLYFDVFRKVNLSHGICKEPITAGSSGGGRDYDILPGAAGGATGSEGSIISYRVHSVDTSVQMPPIARSVKHSEAVDVLDAWINTVIDASYENADCVGDDGSSLPI